MSKRTSLILSQRNMRMRIQGGSLSSNAIKAMPASELVALFANPAEKLVVDVQKGHIDALGRSIRRIERHVKATVLSIPADVAWCDVLLTLYRKDFGTLLDSQIHGFASA